jgi:zinc protease
VFRIRTEVRSDATGPAIAAVLAEMERLRGEPPSAAEMRQAANSLCGAFVLDLETLEGLAEAVLYGLLQDLPEDRLDTFVGKVQAVTARQAQEAARAYLDPGGVSIAAAGDAGKIQEALAGFSAEPVARVDQNGREMRNP